MAASRERLGRRRRFERGERAQDADGVEGGAQAIVVGDDRAERARSHLRPLIALIAWSRARRRCCELGDKGGTCFFTAVSLPRARAGPGGEAFGVVEVVEAEDLDRRSCSLVGPSSNIEPSSLYDRNGRYDSSGARPAEVGEVELALGAGLDGQVGVVQVGRVRPVARDGRRALLAFDGEARR